jgi:hypothetical protein
VGQRWQKILLTILILSAAGISLVVQFANLRHLTSTSVDDAATTPIYNSPPSAAALHDGTLLWITPKPIKPRIVGWEDEYMIQWKNNHYDTTQSAECITSSQTPYNNNLLCHIPAYIPARHISPTTTNINSKIPKVLFMSWFTRHVGPAMFTSIVTLLHHNPEYEFVFFNDDDVDRFICHYATNNDNNNVDDFARSYSKVRAGAMKVDIWRLLVMQQYGGVYLDADLSAVGTFPIGPNDSLVSGLCGWGHLPLNKEEEIRSESVKEKVKERKKDDVDQASSIPDEKLSRRAAKKLLRQRQQQKAEEAKAKEEEDGDNGNDIPMLGCVLEHWAMAFRPHHPLIELAVQLVTNNLAHPEYLMRDDTPEAKIEDSVTMRLTGPAMYQHALRKTMEQSECRLVGNSYCNALKNPEQYCDDMDVFQSYFPGLNVFFEHANLNNTLVHKLFYPASVYVRETEEVLEWGGGGWDYDDPMNLLADEADDKFCNADEMEKRSRQRGELWKKIVERGVEED